MYDIITSFVEDRPRVVPFVQFGGRPAASVRLLQPPDPLHHIRSRELAQLSRQPLGQHLGGDPLLATDHPQLSDVRDPVPRGRSQPVEDQHLPLSEQKHSDDGACPGWGVRSPCPSHPATACEGAKTRPASQASGEQ